MDFRISSILLCLSVLVTSAASGEIKRWIDEKGQVHFGDSAPAGVVVTAQNPKIITTSPGKNNTLEDVLRPGEIRMLNRYERRGRRLSRAKEKRLLKDKKTRKRTSRMMEKCLYHKQKRSDLARRLRKGYKASRKDSINAGIARHREMIRHYCN